MLKMSSEPKVDNICTELVNHIDSVQQDFVLSFLKKRCTDRTLSIQDLVTLFRNTSLLENLKSIQIADLVVLPVESSEPKKATIPSRCSGYISSHNRDVCELPPGHSGACGYDMRRPVLCMQQISKTKFCHRYEGHPGPCDEDGDMEG